MYNPPSPPSDTIKDILEERGLSWRKFGCKCGFSEQYTQSILNGEIEIDEELAWKLSDVLGSSVHFWLNREKNYRESLNKEDK